LGQLDVLVMDIATASARHLLQLSKR
jgi:hypothetical protein